VQGPLGGSRVTASARATKLSELVDDRLCLTTSAHQATATPRQGPSGWTRFHVGTCISATAAKDADCAESSHPAGDRFCVPDRSGADRCSGDRVMAPGRRCRTSALPGNHSSASATTSRLRWRRSVAPPRDAHLAKGRAAGGVQLRACAPCCERAARPARGCPPLLTRIPGPRRRRPRGRQARELVEHGAGGG
jgi:hypothetical protein